MCRLHTAPPSEALVVSGCCFPEPKVSQGGFACQLPCCQQVDRLDLNVQLIEVFTDRVYSKEGIAISAHSSAAIRISRYPEGLRIAATAFLGLDQKQIGATIKKTLEGHQRAIIAELTVEEMYKDRARFNQLVREVASVDLGNLGLEIISFTVKGVEDNEQYLESLGRKRIAEVKRDARIGEAQATRDAVVRESAAKKEQMEAKFQADTEVANSQRIKSLAVASFDSEVNAAKAKANLSGELQSQITKQSIKEQEMEIQLVERQKKIEIETEEIERKKRALEANVIKPAEAEKFKLETLASANKTQKVKESAGQSEALLKIGTADATVVKKIGEAEAATMAMRAEAWRMYEQGAFMETLIDSIPRLVESVAQPLQNVEKITLVSSGDEGIGASKITGEITTILGQLPTAINNLTGVDMVKTLAKLKR